MTRNSDDRIPDPERSAAVLIGGNSYPNLPSLPSARTSVTELKDVLTDRDIWGLPPSRCLVVPDPESAAEIIDPVAEAGALASDMLFVYFSGHGLLDSDHELHLAVSGTERERPFTALAYRYLRATILAAAARRTVVVLDCCYSGNVLGTMGDHDAVFAESARADEIRGVCVITASAEFQQALAPEDDRFTAFSGEFIRVLRHGDPGPRPVLDLNSVYGLVRRGLTERGIRVVPQIRDRNAIGQLPFVPNLGYTGGPVTVPRTTGGKPTSSPSRARRPGRKIAARPFEFEQVRYIDPHLLVQAMGSNWNAALRLVWGADAAGFDRWLRDDVRDLDLPANFMQTGTPDERIARLLAHFAADVRPVFRGHSADATGLAKQCRSALDGDRGSAERLRELTSGLVTWFGEHACQSDHPACASDTGCLRLAQLAAATARAITAVAARLLTRPPSAHTPDHQTYSFAGTDLGRCPPLLRECLTAAALTGQPTGSTYHFARGAVVNWYEGDASLEKVTATPDARIVYDTAGMAIRLRARIFLGVLLDKADLWEDALRALPHQRHSLWWRSLASAPRSAKPLRRLVLDSFLLESAAVAKAEAEGPPPELRAGTPQWREVQRERRAEQERRTQERLERAARGTSGLYEPPEPRPSWGWIVVVVVILICLGSSCEENGGYPTSDGTTAPQSRPVPYTVRDLAEWAPDPSPEADRSSVTVILR
ncbi:caspase family protein [Micromonospora luteifusca]|uniref:caspase family protein n=1 Tax=Micromonospora luteifusca TaxID=709860 RepID=UPI0033B04007